MGGGKFWGGAALFSAMAAGIGAAGAADLAVKAPAPAYVSDWSGFYVGIDGGGGWAKTDFAPANFVPSSGGLFEPPGQHSKGGLVGGHFGYNWQFGRLIAGLEGDYDVADIKSAASIGDTTPSTVINQQLKIDRLGSVRGRFGWAVAPGLLAYGTAGPGLGHFQSTVTQTSVTLNTSGSMTESGWVAGAGLEYKIFENLLLRAEYLHYDFGPASINNTGATGTVPAVDNLDSRTAVDMVRTGLSYKFSPAGPEKGLPALAAKAPASVSDWSGFYLGVNGGFGLAHTSFPLGYSDPLQEAASLQPNTVRAPDQKSSGGLIGGHFGYNWQYGRVVAGVEADYDAADIKSTTGNLDPPPVVYSQEINIDHLASVRGRLGWTVWPDLLAYSTAGLGLGHLQNSLYVFRPDRGSVVETQTAGVTAFGWVAGAGLEYKVLENLLLRAEYLHYDFGTVNNLYFSLSANPPIDSLNARTAVDVVRAGLSYKLGPAGTDPFAPLTVKANAAAPATVSGWSGLYVGINGGGGWAKTDFAPEITVNIAPFFRSAPTQRSSGGLVGGQVGYNWQSGRIVAGLEADFDAADVTSTGNLGPAPTPLVPSIPANELISQTLKLDQLASIRARLGWAISPDLMAYGTGGAGMGHYHATLTEVTPVPWFATAGGGTEFGWVAGAGIEYKLLDHLALRGEYLHYDFGRQNNLTNAITNTGIVDPGNAHTTVDVARAGLSYKF